MIDEIETNKTIETECYQCETREENYNMLGGIGQGMTFWNKLQLMKQINGTEA